MVTRSWSLRDSFITLFKGNAKEKEVAPVKTVHMNQSDISVSAWYL